LFAQDGGTRASPFAFVGRAGLTGPRQVGYRFEGDTTVVEASYESGATPGFRYEIPGRLTLTATDFLLGPRTGPGDDRFAGTPYADNVTGYDGDDRLSGAGGADALSGLGGDDLLDGGAGRDYLFDSEGADILRGGAGDDIVEAGEGADRVDGGEGDDRVDGGEGDDAVSGGGGDDLVFGREGTDRLDGGAGADRLEGTGEGDLLRGGSGGDTFFFGKDYGFGSLGAEAAIIEDFVRGSDTIDVGGVDASRGGAGDQDFTFIGTRAFSGASQLRIAREGGDTVVQGSTDLDRAPEFEIVVRGNLALAADDFVL
jgi:Ca2+-binding RTX toxin-like protein